MDLATRKRLNSASLDEQAVKASASLTSEQPSSFSDILFVNILNLLNITESSQRVPLLEDIISRIQWLKQYHQQYESNNRRSLSHEKSPMGSPRQSDFKPLDHQQMKRCIQKDQQKLQNMSKLITLTQIPAAPLAPPTLPLVQVQPVPVAPPPAPASPAPVPLSAVEQPNKSFVTIPLVSQNPVMAISPKKETVKKTDNAERRMDPPKLPVQIEPPTNPSKLFAQSAEEMMQDLQEKQRKLLAYISSAHNGNVTDEVLHDYLRHPFILLKENGVVRKQLNPFYHLMSQPGSTGVPSIIPMPKMMAPSPNSVSKTAKPATPIPEPPVLVPQIELPVKKEFTLKNETFSPPIEKVQASPPPQLPPQLPLQIPTQPPIDPKSPFVAPIIRTCNQWSVVSMALPLRLICRCNETPCKCQ